MADNDFRALAMAYRKAAEGLPEFGRAISSKLASNAVGDIERRIVRTGKRADGADIGEYSPSYLAYKKKKGKYKGHVDLQLTTRMWSNTGVTNQKVSGGGSFVVTIAAKSPENQKKLDDNAARFGFDPLELSPAEVDELSLDFDEDLQLYLDQNGL